MNKETILHLSEITDGKLHDIVQDYTLYLKTLLLLCKCSPCVFMYLS